MTKKTFTLFMALFIIVSANAQQVEEVQRAIVTKRTATWCPNCGNWGWTLMENIVDDNAGKAIIIAAHETGSSLGIDAAEEITANWGTFSQPSFFVNEVNQNASSSTIAAKRTDIKAQVDAAFSSQPTANVGFDPVYQDGEIKVDAKVKFFQQATGDFYLGIYLLEDNVMANQSGSVSDNIHERVMRYSFTDGSWGMPLTNGNVAADTELSQSFALQIGDPTGYDYHVVGIIWNLDGGIYKPVNAWSTMTISTTSAVEEVPNLVSFKASPSVSTNTSNIELEVADNQANATLSVFDASGKMVAELHKGMLSAGLHSFELSKAEVGQSGIYFVRFTDGEKVNSLRVVFQ